MFRDADPVRLVNSLLSGRGAPAGAGEQGRPAGLTARAEPAEDSEDPTDRPGGPEPATVTEPHVEPGCTPEEYVLRLLDRNGGCLTQRAVLARLGWSERVGRKLLTSMETGGAIDRHHSPGEKKRIALPGEAPWRHAGGADGD